MRTHLNRFARFASLWLALFALGSTVASAQVSVWTHHNDNARTGANLAEVQLNTANVNTAQFGKLFAYSVDAAMYSQPLVIPNVSIPGQGLRNVIYVVTMNNSVYAFDADDATTDSGQPIWHVNFNNPGAGITPVPSTDIGNSVAYRGPYGITGTPVIDQASKTIYLVARTKESGAYFQRLHALDITTGQERPGSPVAISAVFTNIDGTTVTFNPKMENQRPALALANGRVYVSWASVEDLNPYQGWVIAYDATTLQKVGAFNTAPKGSMAGIWMSGQAPSVDANGNLYLTTGNGSWNGTTNFAQSILKLSPSLALLDWFTPDNWNTTSGADLDLASSGVLLVPGTHLALAGSKEGRLYLLDTASMGHQVTGNGQIPQLLQATPFGHHIHGAPVYWDGPTGRLVYIWAEEDRMKAFSFNGQTLSTTPVSQSTFADPPGMPGAVLAVSANGSASGTGIVWTSMPLSLDGTHDVVPGVLRAFDATDLSKLLWSSATNCRDAVGSFAKWVPPTVANGKVYLATFSNQLLVYGRLSGQAPASGGLVGSVTCNSNSVNLTAVGTSDWAKWPNYVHKASGASQISNYALVGTGAVQTYTDPRTLSWSDGTPTASGSDKTGVFVAGTGNGFRISAPADTTSRTLYVYVGGWNSTGLLTAHLSDNSSPDYVNAASGAGQYDAVYTIIYKAASAGQQLVVSWTQGQDTGNVTLQGVALSGSVSALLPPTGVSASDGTSATSVTVTWVPSANATSYTVYRSTAAGIQGASVGTTNTTGLTDTTVTPGTTYYYSVTATGPGGTSAASMQDSGFAAAAQGGGVITGFTTFGNAASSAASQTTTASTAPPGATASLAVAGSVSSATVNLTAGGSTDWAKWPNYIHKASGGSQISMVVTVGAVALTTYTGDPRTVTWSDGAPTASGSDQAGLFVSGVGTGFLITAPANTTSRTLNFYVGGFNSSGVLIAHLSDGSAPDYVVTTTPVMGQYDLIYTITYRAASNGQRLSVNWTQASGSGNVTLQAATLK